VHTEVQLSVFILIEILIEYGDYSRAENYSRIHYENITDPLYGLDQEGLIIAAGVSQLADIWLKIDPVEDEKAAFALAEEAEKLIRKSCSINEKVYGHELYHLAADYGILGSILIKRGSNYSDRITIHKDNEGSLIFLSGFLVSK
jgi:hypothetical protein